MYPIYTVYFHHKFSAITWRADDIRPYGIVRTVAMLGSGIICFLTLQAIYTNWARRLALRADNIRPSAKITVINRISIVIYKIITMFKIQLRFNNAVQQ